MFSSLPRICIVVVKQCECIILTQHSILMLTAPAFVYVMGDMPQVLDTANRLAFNVKPPESSWSKTPTFTFPLPRSVKNAQ